MLLSKEEIDHIKQSHDLVSFIQGNGIPLTRKGRNYVGLCPFHEETKPSFTVNPKRQLWHCFGCGEAGDVIGFLTKSQGIGFRQAVEKLAIQTTESGRRTTATAQTDQETKRTPKLQRLLNRVMEYYQAELLKDPRGLDYLQKERGITDKQSILDFKTGFASGNLLDVIPDDGDIVSDLKSLGILNDRGKELFFDSVTFPLLDENNNVLSIYGRRIQEGEIHHLYLPGPKHGIINRQAAKRSKSILLTESIIDALSLYNAGFKNVIPCYGVNGLTEDHLFLFNRFSVEEVYISFDSDPSGKDAAIKMGEQLKEKGITSFIVDLPDKDINDYFLRHTPEEFESLLKAANPESLERSTSVSKREETICQKTGPGLILGIGDRRYEIKGIARQGTQLKATIKAYKEQGRFELSTIDLYSLRSRQWFASLCVGLFGETEELIKEDLNRLLEKVEAQGSGVKESTKKELSREQKEEALRFLTNPKLFDEILDDLETAGMTGEEMNKLLCYIASVSRRMEEPLSILIRSRSAAGKSTLQDAILSLIPEEDYVQYTRITDQALFYKDEDSLVHKLLAIEEATGMNGAAYSIRAIQSSKHLTVAATSKDPITGKMKTEEYKVKGPVSIFLTTTEVEIDEEMESRFLTVTIDESSKMTSMIHEKQRYLDTLDGYLAKRTKDRIITKHQNAQRLLRTLPVINPYSPYLTYPKDSLFARRDNQKYLNLIKAICFLHQYQREKKTINHNGEVLDYIEVTLDDIERANQIANEVLGQSLDDLTAPARRLLLLIHKMVEEICKKEKLEVSEYTFSRRQIREYTKWSDWQIKNHIKELEEMEYLYSRMGSKGKEYIYEIRYHGQGTNGQKFFLGLTTVEQLKRKLGGSYRDLEGKKGNLEGTRRPLVGSQKKR
jgi:DNA primase catalytic core